ncbi:peptidoglycan-binding protein [Mycolicibacterium sp. BiH015]|uniref:peptidoglycan-binding protein n=1 Tax=Mycolicibacterium sp. BiH015 TaxID=3018808 RepID=UPI0022E80D67|nr:peptidoglycan-binding protein [Mycolicibacterium sp. BiH015]MDA2894840.1 peptidoglycan-binding protein [Mycolicibacterium sp. BiH015]
MSTQGLSPEELMAESAIALPDKEVVSILDLNADVDVALDAASPIDLAAAANLNVAAPIDAAAGANVLAYGSGAQATVDQGTSIEQMLDADAYATSTQASGIDQGGMDTDGDEVPVGGTDTDGDGTTYGTDVTDTSVDTSAGGLLDGNLLNVNVNVDLDADLAAPISGAVAANANVAAPINAGVSANIGSIDSDAISVAEQDAIIKQTVVGEAVAEADQDSTISQGDGDADAGTDTVSASGTSDAGSDSSAG